MTSVYRALAFWYKLSPRESSELTPFQQLALLTDLRVNAKTGKLVTVSQSFEEAGWQPKRS